MDYFKYLSASREQFMAWLSENDFKCNAAGRNFMAERVKVIAPRPVTVDEATLDKAEELGSFLEGSVFEYTNADGKIATVRVCSLYNLPKNMENPYLYCFGGVMTAPFYAFEILRFYAKQTGKLLPFVSSGKEGNKGLFNKLFYRDYGLIRKTEYDSYYAIMARMSEHRWLYSQYETFNDDTTEGNLMEMYRFAKDRGIGTITLILCTGNPYYDKRLVAEWMWLLKNSAYASVKINLVVAHCPRFISESIAIPEARISEIYLGYIAACLGPLRKDTITLDGKTQSEKPERYLMPGVKETDWTDFRDIIVNHSNMGWPNYQEIIYGIPHQEAVANIILSDLFARASYTPQDYDRGIDDMLQLYIRFLGGPFVKGDFCKYLRNTVDKRFF